MAGDSGSPIRIFDRGEVASYEEWVRKHGGYVLTQRTDGFMLHHAECSIFGLIPGTFDIAKPRRWASTRGPLVEWTEDRTGNTPLLCRRCM
jgi:hypothetical protein